MSRKKRRSCRGKVRYRDAPEARRALRRTQKRGEREARQWLPVRFYECPLCKGWHLTSQGRKS